MRALTLILAGLLILIQYPLWLGKGGWLKVWDLDRQLQAYNRVNVELKQRNASLAAEVKDLKEGAGAVEERARYELGMLKEGELFVQITEQGAAQPAVPAASTSATPAKPAAPAQLRQPAAQTSQKAPPAR